MSTFSDLWKNVKELEGGKLEYSFIEPFGEPTEPTDPDVAVIRTRILVGDIRHADAMSEGEVDRIAFMFGRLANLPADIVDRVSSTDFSIISQLIAQLSVESSKMALSYLIKAKGGKGGKGNPPKGKGRKKRKKRREG